MESKTLTVLVSIALVAILGCETTNENNIENARLCLDNATKLAASNSASASTMATTSCEPPIANIQTAEAGFIGVGIVMVEEQKLSILATIQSAIKSGISPIAFSISNLAFSVQAHVTNINNYAQLSADNNAITLANMITLSYYTSVASGGSLNSNSTQAQISAFVTTLSSDPVNGPPAALALLAAKTSACGGGSTSTYCTDITNTIGANTSSYTIILTNAAAYISAGG